MISKKFSKRSIALCFTLLIVAGSILGVAANTKATAVIDGGVHEYSARMVHFNF